MKILVINGVNLNMLGCREPDLYGRLTLADLEQFIQESAAELNLDVNCWQSNHEGEIVEKIQSAIGVYDALVINAGAYTHTSLAILDALRAAALPTVEVHLTDPAKREAYRRFSYVGEYAQASIAGQGFDGYRQALDYLHGLQPE